MAQNGAGRARRAGNSLFVNVLVASFMSMAPLPAALAQPVSVSEEQKSFNIPGGSRSGVLAQFGRQAGIQVSYLPEIASGKQSPGVSGTATVSDALAQLLAGTGLSFQFTGARTVTIAGPAADAGGPLTLGVITVEGEGESAYGPVAGYMAGRSASATKTDTAIMDIPGSIEVVPRQVIED